MDIFWNHTISKAEEYEAWISCQIVPKRFDLVYKWLLNFSFFIVLGADVTLSIPLISAKVGTTASVTCTVTGETFDGWYKPDSSKITTSSGANIRVESSGNDHVLKFVDVQLSYGSNNYQCRGSKNTEKFWFHVASKYMSFHFNLHVCYPTLLHGGQIANMNNYF